MEVLHNIKTYSISWLISSYDSTTATGIIENYYIPSNLAELKSICIDLIRNKEPYKIVGHTSNVYFLPNTSIRNLISTRRVNKWLLKENILTCDCGVNVKTLTRAMIEKGVEGFAGMIDLPGTIGGAIYGNSSVSTYSISNLIESVTVLTETGDFITLTNKDLGFQFRSSVFKRSEIKGTILSCTLQVKKGDRNRELETAEIVHKWRKNNQPGPLNNLGTTAILEKRTFFGFLLSIITKVLKLKGGEKAHFILACSGGSSLKSYTFGLNRYMWKNSRAHLLFPKYLNTIKRIYRDVKLEIEVW